MNISTTLTRATATLTALLTVSLSACSQSTGPSTDAASPAAGPLGTVQTMFGSVEVPQPADGELTVVALGWSDAEMALDLGIVPVAVLDWQSFGAGNKGVGPWATSLFGDTTPEIIERGAEALNYEQIQGLDPDLILNTRSGNDQGEFDRLSEIAPTVYGPEGAGAYATEWTDQLTLIGQATGQAAEARQRVDEVTAQIAAAARAHPEFDGLTTASVAKFGDAYGAYLPGDGRFDILADLGLANNPAVEEQQSSGFFANVSAENVTAFDADTAVILPLGYTLAQTEKDPLLRSLSVVEDDRAVFIDPDSELAGAWGASSALSIPVVLDQLVPPLAEAASRAR